MGETGFTTRPELAGTFGMVSSTHWLASAAGMAMLERGGNAFDAAVAAAFTLHVVEPHLNGPGGDAPIIFARGDDPRPRVLCGQGPAPAGASAAAYRALGLDVVPGTGFLAAAIPGAVDAWLVLLRDHGTMTLDAVMEAAIGYAERGHPLLPRARTTIEAVSDLFRRHWPTSAAVYLPGGRPPRAHRLFRNTALAATYRRLVEAGRAASGDRERQIDAARTAWRQGFVAEAIERFVGQPHLDASGEARAGVLTAHDMATWSPPYEDPVTYDFGEYTVCKTGPWGQGPVLLQQLALLDGFPDAALRPGGADCIHYVVECAKLAFADREAWYGDAAEVPLDHLLSPAYTAERRALVGDRASWEFRPGRPGGREPRVSASLRWRDPQTRVLSGEEASAAFGEPTVPPALEPRGDTCHVDAVDRFGNLVAATPSGGWLQSSPVVPELGFPLGTRLQMTWLEDGLPSTLTPGRRPLTTLSPTLAMRGRTPVLAFGTPGGDQQDQWQLPFFLGVVIGELDLQAAIDAPTWHTTAVPGSFHPRTGVRGEVVVEERVGEAIVAELRRRGHHVTVSDPWSLGRMCAVGRDPETGVLRAGANPRQMQGYAVGR